MYLWMWRHLPGNAVAKLAASLFAAGVVVVLLFLLAFPFISAHLPFSHVTVGN